MERPDAGFPLGQADDRLITVAMDDGFIEFVPVQRIVSPCIDICEIDPVSRLCRGCARTTSEIAGWSSGSDSWRDAVMRDLPGRR